MSEAIEKSAMRKIYFRLLPFAVLSYILVYIDRINVSFAALTMRGDLHMSAGVYGFALGTFYWGYCLFGIPSNVVLERVGARVVIATLMIFWGLFAGITAITVGPTSFGVVRFLVGAAEAGFFPGLILYFTYWFPANHHARIVSGFLMGLPISVALGAPISTALLGLDGFWGLKGWQVMYIAEAIPTVLLGFATLFILVDKPDQAKYLTTSEKSWLAAKLLAERKAKEMVRVYSVWRAMFDPKVLLLSLNFFGIVTASLGLLFFVPQIIKSIGVTNYMTIGWLTMIPYIFGAISMVVWGYLSDRMNERRWNLFIACVVSTIGLAIAGLTMGSWWAVVGMTIASVGFYGSKGPFWAMPPMFLTGSAAAVSIAWINSIGNLGGFFGPWYVGAVKDMSGSYSGGLYGLALLCLIASIICAFFLHIPNRLPHPPSASATGAGKIADETNR